MVTVPVPIRDARDASYEICIGRGLLADLPAHLAARRPAAAYAVVSDSHVGPLYGAAVVRTLERAGVRAELVTFPAGEASKTRETWAHLTDRLLALHFGRDAAVVALGGGVVGDVAGFVAATYLRGIPYVQAPTSLLAMIDSSIGGKTGIDVPAGKNLVGAFLQPTLVLADLDVLATLPARELAAGMAEAIKHGAIADERYFAQLEGAAAAVTAHEAGVLQDVVRRSVEIKADVVSRDERETGVRAVLNFGHTVAHALETVAGFTLSHGEAVAAGMVIESRLGERLGVTAAGTAQRVAAALEHYHLPTARPANQSPAELLDAMRHDKKVRATQIRFALPERIGAMHRETNGAHTIAAPDEAILEALAAAD